MKSASLIWWKRPWNMWHHDASLWMRTLRRRPRKTKARHQPRESGARHRPRETGAQQRPWETAARHQPQDTGARRRLRATGAQHQPQDTKARHRLRATRARPRLRKTKVRQRPRDTEARRWLRATGARQRLQESGARLRPRATVAQRRPRDTEARHRLRATRARQRPRGTGARHWLRDTRARQQLRGNTPLLLPQAGTVAPRAGRGALCFWFTDPRMTAVFCMPRHLLWGKTESSPTHGIASTQVARSKELINSGALRPPARFYPVVRANQPAMPLQPVPQHTIRAGRGQTQKRRKHYSVNGRKQPGIFFFFGSEY